MQSVAIRRANSDDANALSQFMRKLADEGLDTIGKLRPTAQEETAFISAAEKNGRAFILVAVVGRDVVGVLDLWAGEKSSSRHAGRVGVSVLASYRRQGIGRALVEKALVEAKGWPDFCRVELEVVPWNEPAFRLYQSTGFVVEGTKRKAVVLDGKATDLVQMALIW